MAAAQGEPITKLRPFREGDAPHPYLLSMTAAGQSALNIQGLDTVVIEDAQFTTVVRNGKRVLTKLPLGANEILQMAGRVHGRVAEGEVWILSERDIDFHSLQPTEPNFQLAGDPEQLSARHALPRLHDLEHTHGSVMKGLGQMMRAGRGSGGPMAARRSPAGRPPRTPPTPREQERRDETTRTRRGHQRGRPRGPPAQGLRGRRALRSG